MECFNHPRKGLQDLRILPAMISLGVFFLIPQADGDCLVTFRGDETDLILKSPLSSEQRNDFPSRMRVTPPCSWLELEADVATNISTSWVYRLEG